MKPKLLLCHFYYPYKSDNKLYSLYNSSFFSKIVYRSAVLFIVSSVWKCFHYKPNYVVAVYIKKLVNSILL